MFTKENRHFGLISVLKLTDRYMPAKAKPDKLTKGIPITNIYLPDPQWQMLELSWVHLGYSPRTIAKNALQGFFARNREYYSNAALMDAESRGMDAREHYLALREGRELKPILEPANHLASPIAWVPNLMIVKNKRRYGSVEISNFNYTLLQVAVLLDGGTIPSVISKCVYAHLGELYSIEPNNPRSSGWARSYYPQIKLNEDCCYTIAQWNQEINTNWETL